MIQSTITNQTEYVEPQSSLLASVLPMAATIAILASAFAGYLLALSIN